MTNNLKKHSRVDVADVLRGFAVMGIILLHSIEHFNFGCYPDTSTQSTWLNFTDSAIWEGMFFTFGGKAYAIFALLFGFSFFIQYDNQRVRGNDFRLRFCWRLLLLFIIGNINAAFFTAEILVLYSIVGFILPLTCRLSDRKLLAIACFLLIQPLPLIYVIQSIIDPSFVTPVIPTKSFWAATRVMQGSGSFFEMVATNLKEGQLASLAWAWDHGRIFQTTALFILGLLVGRRGLFSEDSVRFWAKTLAVSLMVFFPIYGITNMLPEYIANKSTLAPLKLMLSSWSNLAFMFILVSSIIITYYKSNLKGRMSKIIPYGKMSLTNYITQSIVGSMIFYHWGFGLADKVGITGSIFIGAALFVAQYQFCKWWLSRHNQGPMEYIWKKATWI